MGNDQVKEAGAKPAQALEGIQPENWFSTPIWSRRLVNYERVNKHLLEVTELLEKEAPSVTRSNVGGWHSMADLHQDARLLEIRQIIGQVSAECARSLAFDFEKADLIYQGMWINKNKTGDFNKAHIHPNAILSGSYYIKVPPESGNIEFYDPVRERLMTPYPIKARTAKNSSPLEYKARDGLLIIFPSWLQHAVQPNRSDDVRVSMAFNMGYRPKRTQR
jgi:uncharacterized protein (TIGR02466 family)